MTATATLRPSGAFPATVMIGITHVTPSIPRLVCVEMVERLLTASGHWSPVTMSRIIAIIYMTIEAMRTVEPRTSSNEKAAIKPIRSIVAVRRTAIGRIVIIAIGTTRFRSYVDADLSACLWTGYEKETSSKSQ
jgi:hypothetical protein